MVLPYLNIAEIGQCLLLIVSGSRTSQQLYIVSIINIISNLDKRKL